MTLRVTLVRLPLLVPFSNSAGTMAARNALILQLQHGGIEALSECVTDTGFSSTREDNRTALKAITKFSEKLEGEPPSPREFLRQVGRKAGNQMAKAAVEMLLWDYMAKAKGEPLDKALGRPRGRADVGVAIGLSSPTKVKRLIEDALERGYRRVKVKIDRDGALETLSWIREEFPGAPLSADANGCFNIKDLHLLKRLDRFDLQYLEQPLDGGIEEHAKLARELSTPICLDESVTSLSDAKEAMASGAARVVNVKPGRVGGLSVANEIVRAVRAKGGHVWVGGMLETGVGRAFNVALASQEPVDYPGDTSPNDRYFERDEVKNPFAMDDGTIVPNSGEGIGVVLDRGYIAKVTVKSWKMP